MAEAVVEREEPKQKKRSLGKLLLLVINLLLFISGLGFFSLTHFGIINTSSAITPNLQQQTTGTDSTKVPEELTTVSMRPFVVNLSGNHGRRFLRVVLQLQVKGAQTEQAIDEHRGQIRDRLIFLLSSKTYEDISSVQGKYQLQEEIVQHLNEALGGSLVTKIYFTEFIVQ